MRRVSGWPWPAATAACDREAGSCDAAVPNSEQPEGRAGSHTGPVPQPSHLGHSCRKRRVERCCGGLEKADDLPLGGTRRRGHRREQRSRELCTNRRRLKAEWAHGARRRSVQRRIRKRTVRSSGQAGLREYATVCPPAPSATVHPSARSRVPSSTFGNPNHSACVPDDCGLARVYDATI